MKKNNFRLIATLVGVALMAGFSIYAIKSSSGKILMNGDLRAAHSFLGADCLKCHTPLRGVKASACEACHADKAHFQAPDATKVSAAPGAPKCFDCHGEHRGRSYNAAIVESKECLSCHSGALHQSANGFGTVAERGIRFPHDMHASMGAVSEEQCATCHDVSAPGAVRLAVKFNDSCNSCHPIEKHGFDSPNMDQCAKCHASGIFGPTPAPEAQKAAFSHKGHGRLSCIECHPVLAGDAAALKTRPAAADCLSCHATRGVSSECANCHSYHPSR